MIVRTPYLTDGLGEVYDTGDLGRHLPDGRVALTGRADGRVKIDGFRAEPAEVDAFVRRLPYVRECLTVARPGPDGRPCLVTYAVPADHQAPSLERLRADLRADLPAYLLPTGLVSLRQLPLTPAGKHDRSALPPWTPTAVRVAAAPPRTTLEKSIAQIWRSVLNAGPVGVDGNFFDLGGSSLLMIGVQQRLEAQLGRQIPVLTLFEYPTVRALACHLADPEATAPPRPAPVSPVFPDARHRLGVRREIRLKDMS